MLQHNRGNIEADVPLSGELKGATLPQRMEELIRSNLTRDENERVRLVFHHKGKAIPEAQKSEGHKTTKLE